MVKSLLEIFTTNINWAAIRTELKERFFNWDTASSVYIVPASATTFYYSLFDPGFAWTVGTGSLAWYLLSVGLYRLWRNPVKAEAERWAMVEARLAKMEKVSAGA